MKMTVNLYTDRRYSYRQVCRQICRKNPIIFVVPKDAPESVYNTINVSDDMRKGYCVIRGFNLQKTAAFLASFTKLHKRSILIMAPAKYKKRTIKFAHDVIHCIGKINLSRLSLRKKRKNR